MGRRAVLLISTMAVALAVASGVVLAANINCEAGALSCSGTLTADTMTGTNGVDNMSGAGGGDTMYGRGSGDTLSGDEGNDSLVGEGGGDTYAFGPGWGADTITGGEDSGEDTLDFSSILESLDIDLVSSTGRDEVFSRGGMLNFPAAVVIENVNGGNARDVIRGNDVINHLSGKGGNDSLLGRGGNDRLFGGPGADAFNGGPGNDDLTGSDAVDVFDNDVYTFQDGWGADKIVSDAAGTDHLFFGELPNTASVNVDLGAGTATAGTNTVTWIPANANIENATGGAGIDTLRGNNSANTLNGQGGNDTIYGLGGVDKVSGDAPGLSTLTGDDTIHVEDGDPGDTVDCGPGNDTVYVDAKLNDLTPEPDDKIRLDTFFDEENCELIVDKLID